MTAAATAQEPLVILSGAQQEDAIVQWKGFKKGLGIEFPRQQLKS